MALFKGDTRVHHLQIHHRGIQINVTADHSDRETHIEQIKDFLVRISSFVALLAKNVDKKKFIKGKDHKLTTKCDRRYLQIPNLGLYVIALVNERDRESELQLDLVEEKIIEFIDLTFTKAELLIYLAMR
jgi:hypothetical protein